MAGNLLQEQVAEQRLCHNCGSALPDRRCANCGAAFAGPYCAQCGQKESAGRYTLRRLLVVPLGQLLNLDRGFLHTALRLTVAPGQVVRDFLAGRAAPYTHPVVYLLVSFAAFALLARWTNAFQPAPESDPSWVLPVFFVAAVSRLIFWHSRLNYAEHLILGSYLVGHVMLFFAVVLVAIRAASSFAALMFFVALGLGAGYIAWGYSRFFDRRPLLAAVGGLVAALGGTALYLGALIVVLNMLRARGII